MSNPNDFGSQEGAPKGDWPPAPPGTTKSSSNGSIPPWQKKAAIAAAAVGVTLLGVVVAKKRSGKSDEEIEADLKGAGKDAKRAAQKGAKVAEDKGKDLWGFSKEKAQDVKEDLPGQTNKLVEDVKTAAWEGGKDVKRGAEKLAGKAKGVFEEELEPNYGFLGWRHIFNNPKMGKKGNA